MKLQAAICVKEKAEEQKGQLKSLSKDSSTSTYDNKSGAYQKQLNSLNPNAATPNNYWELIKAKHYIADEEMLTGYHFFSKNEAICADKQNICLGNQSWSFLIVHWVHLLVG